MRSEFLEYLASIDQPISGHVLVRLAEGLMQRRAIGVIEPVAWIERKEFQFGAFGQVRRLVHDQAAGGDASFDRHARQRSSTEAGWLDSLSTSH